MKEEAPAYRLITLRTKSKYEREDLPPVYTMQRSVRVMVYLKACTNTFLPLGTQQHSTTICRNSRPICGVRDTGWMLSIFILAISSIVNGAIVRKALQQGGGSVTLQPVVSR